jgi:hypothetical protein
VAAADVRHPTAALELLLDALERRDPVAHEMRPVARPEEALGAMEEPVVVFVPTQAAARSERLGEFSAVLRLM